MQTQPVEEDARIKGSSSRSGGRKIASRPRTGPIRERLTVSSSSSPSSRFVF
jgi:hypothetical protein